MSIQAGSVQHPTSSLGGEPGYFCRYCALFIAAPTGAPDPQRCPTPGCTRPTGFGRFADVRAALPR